MINKGYVPIPRNLEDWEYYDKKYMVPLLIHLAIRANFSPKRWRGIDIGRGQLWTGRGKLSIATGIPECSIRTCLKDMKKTAQKEFRITIKPTNKGSLITLCGYDSWGKPITYIHQQDSQQDSQQYTNHPPTTNQPSHQQTTTTKE